MAEMMAWPLNLVEYGYNAEDVMRWMAGKTSGVYGQEGNFQVVHKSGMTITVKAEGMTGGWLTNMQRYGVAFWNATDIDLTVDGGDGTNPRVDRVVVSWHIPNQSELPQVLVRKGAPAAEPVGPALVNDGEYAEICLAEIAVAAGAVSLSNEVITDTRLDEELCGIVSMGLEKYPTDGYEQQFIDWFQNLQYTLSGDVAGNLYNEIMASRAKVFEFTALASAWEGMIPEQSITLQGLPEDGVGEFGVSETATDAQWDAYSQAMIRPVETDTPGVLQLRVMGSKPLVDIPMIAFVWVKQGDGDEYAMDW